ncbi:TetR family transcriptional regulator [Azospirillum sp. RWY-5-1]|uniref:TetR family transcriptional regulator n=1 Tax=Azospirillum oleiclasticum TaxID=2735135 RepID=A0ABX2T916_9PROT|nr:TetR family transcriptional regulator [Azospirillum oleiclasticum]NYZ12586.1 TetR family transcriptional regulator [Azospirillum oleiclasticum]NYZ19746.1 TetR family transcriptional regulator [Azospirillum oleiclasticum]
MAPPASPRISSRKAPKQARSTALVEAVLQAAAQVLAREGTPRFTMARVAEAAGVSVGSLYQYFPNKAALLFRLQSDEWRETGDLLGRILEDRARPPFDRLRAVVHAFIRSECEEAALRVALDDAAPFYRNAPEAHAAKASGSRVIRNFLEEVLPHATEEQRALAGTLIKTTMSQVGKTFSETAPSEDGIRHFADSMADMFCAYLKQI